MNRTSRMQQIRVEALRTLGAASAGRPSGATRTAVADLGDEVRQRLEAHYQGQRTLPSSIRTGKGGDL